MLRRVKRMLGKSRQERLLREFGVEHLPLIDRIRDEKLTYLTRVHLASIAATCDEVKTRGVPGAFVEAGCALGGSAALISTLKPADRAFYVYDVFGMIPAPTEEDSADVHDRYREIVAGQSEGIDGDKYYGYEENLYERVLENLARYGVTPESHRVELIKGLLQDTMTLDEPIAFAHIDVDWYDPVMTCLQRLFPLLSVGGSIILDDYFAWGGCRKATDEYLRDVVGQFAMDDSARTLKLTRTKSA